MLALTLICAFASIVLVSVFIYYSPKSSFFGNTEKSKRNNLLYTQELETQKVKLQYIHDHLLPFEMRYCSQSELKEKQAEIKTALITLQRPKRYKTGNALDEVFQRILHYLAKGETLRLKHNQAFVASQAKELGTYFGSLLANPLDAQQVDAILHDEDNTLVIAGAGCGKTTTIQGKVQYLLDQHLAQPKEILLLSFAKRNADDLKEKLGHLGVDCRTFHSLAYQIMKEADRPVDIMSPQEAEQIILKSHIGLLGDGAYLASFNDLILNGLRPIKHQNEFSSYKEYIQYLKDSEFESLKGMLAKKNYKKGTAKTTIKTEFVKSGEECYLANFLFLNGVQYSYESPYPYQTDIDGNQNDKQKKRYRPDFTIYLNGYNEHTIATCPDPKKNMLFLEHYGIDEQGKTPQFFWAPEGQSTSGYYKDLMKWKDRLHKYHGTVLIKSYSYEFRSNSLEENLLENLRHAGVKVSPKSNQEIYGILENAYQKEIDAVIKLFVTFINLLKSNNKTFEELYRLNDEASSLDKNMRHRNRNLLALIERVHGQYEKELIRNKKIDFNDLINHSVKNVNQGSYRHSYTYILVDEFQDISISRYQLLDALRQQSNLKLFAVGDDWQSIYRFSGSDLTLFKQFDAYFGCTITKKIETTYRFSEPLIGLSSNFILKNPNQRKKKLRSNKKHSSQILFHDKNESADSISSDIVRILNDLYREYGDLLQEKSVTLLGRYAHDFNQLTSDAQCFVNKEKVLLHVKTELKDIKVDRNGKVTKNNILNYQKNIPFMTVHSAKGMESDIVILINCQTGKYGFPAEISDDPILDLLLSGEDQYPNGEERRAFYVALTRSKEKFICLVYRNSQSKFLTELQASLNGERLEKNVCERCDGELRKLREYSGKTGQRLMYGCTNYKYGCEYIYYENA